jgi:hypothetical protein
MSVEICATDSFGWALFAQFSHKGARALFSAQDTTLVFPASVLAHSAIEMYLKAALIKAGCAVFNPRDVKKVDPALRLEKSDCAWGHNLMKLGLQFASREAGFDLQAVILDRFPTRSGGLTVEGALEIFDPYFSEIRYPSPIEKLDGIGPAYGVLLDKLVERLLPFVPNVSPPSRKFASTPSSKV